MSQERTYTLIERDHYGETINTITGLTKTTANGISAVLARGTAYTGDRPRTCEVVAELTPAEKAQQLAEQWLADKDTNLHTAVELATALELLTTGLRSLGDQHLGDVWMTVDLQVCSSRGDEPARRTAVDLLAQVVGTSQSERPGLYGNSDARVRVYTTIAKPKPAPEPQALAEDVPPAQGVEAPAVKHGHIPAERVDELLYELNQLTAVGGNWWDWICDVPEFDREVTAAAVDTDELHLVDGTVLRWADKTAWTRMTVGA